MNEPKVLILKADGTNCDEETAFAFELAGGRQKIVHINELRNKDEKLKDYNIIAIPGGFSYGDDIVSGKILAVELASFFSEELTKFIERKNTLVIGICNGFQVLVRTGLLPFRNIGKMDVTLTNNDSGHFECRWIKGRIENSRCLFLKDLEEQIVSYTVAHGEGKFFGNKDVINKIEKEKLVSFRYVNEKGDPTQTYPDNPNGSLNAIMGICDATGRILGLMPHPERFVRLEQYPNWRREKILRQVQDRPHGLPIFKKMIDFVKKT